MSEAHTILAELKAKRVEADRLDACVRELRKPWHAPFWSLVAQLPWLAVANLNFNGKHPLSLWLISAVALISVGAVLIQVRQRDKMWREVIAKKSPDLARKLYR